MKKRTPSYVITPVHIYGYRAPGIHVDADSYDQAKKIAKAKCHLVKSFPKKWSLV